MERISLGQYLNIPLTDFMLEFDNYLYYQNGSKNTLINTKTHTQQHNLTLETIVEPINVGTTLSGIKPTHIPKTPLSLLLNIPLVFPEIKTGLVNNPQSTDIPFLTISYRGNLLYSETILQDVNFIRYIMKDKKKTANMIDNITTVFQYKEPPAFKLQSSLRPHIFNDNTMKHYTTHGFFTILTIENYNKYVNRRIP